MKKPPTSFTAFAGRHAAPPARPAAPPPPTPKKKTPGVVARPLRLKPAVTRMLQDLSEARPGLSLNELITVLIVETWNRVFQPVASLPSSSTIGVAVAAAVAAKDAPSSTVPSIVEAVLAASVTPLRHPRDTTPIPDSAVQQKNSARTLRLRSEVDSKLGDLSGHYGGLDRNSTISLVLTSAWRQTFAPASTP